MSTESISQENQKKYEDYFSFLTSSDALLLLHQHKEDIIDLSEEGLDSDEALSIDAAHFILMMHHLLYEVFKDPEILSVYTAWQIVWLGTKEEIHSKILINTKTPDHHPHQFLATSLPFLRHLFSDKALFQEETLKPLELLESFTHHLPRNLLESSYFFQVLQFTSWDANNISTMPLSPLCHNSRCLLEKGFLEQSINGEKYSRSPPRL